MNNDIMIIVTAVAFLAAAAGYLIAMAMGRKSQTDSYEQLITIKTEQAQLQQLSAEQTKNLDAAAAQQRSLELSLKQTETKHESDNLRKIELDTELQQARKKIDTQIEQVKTAEKNSEAVQAELKELRNQEKDLKERLQMLEGAIEDCRNQLASQKQATAQQAEKSKEFEIKAQESDKNSVDLKQRLGELNGKYEDLHEKYNSICTEHSELKTQLDERDTNHSKQLQQFENQKKELTKEFENLANKIFEEKGKSFSATSQNSIDQLLKPFREQIETFQKRVNDVHDESIKGNSKLEAEINKVLSIGLKMSDEASSLTSALKGDSQQRGAWGEAQLERTLEMSGLIEDAHYEKQSSFKDADGKHKQTDYLIKLPDNKHIIIDSKVSLLAYDKAVSAATPEAEKLALNEHVKAVKKHITDLQSKDYTNLIGMRSPSFVLMFMPIEPAYIEALKNNKDLFSYGYERGIVLVSHTTLIPILRTVANLWMMERSNQEAREISDKAGDIYNQVCTVAERLQKLGVTLGTVSNHYNNTVKALVGQQGLHGKVERFNQLSSKVSKSMPALEPAHIDFESERLLLAAEPIKDDADEASQVAEAPPPQAISE